MIGHLSMEVITVSDQIKQIPGFPDELRRHVLHLLLSHHGKLEFGSPVEPMTVEAEIVHRADESSAKANDMMESLEDGESFSSGGEFSDKRIWRVGRRIWRRPHGWD